MGTTPQVLSPAPLVVLLGGFAGFGSHAPSCRPFSGRHTKRTQEGDGTYAVLQRRAFQLETSLHLLAWIWLLEFAWTSWTHKPMFPHHHLAIRSSSMRVQIGKETRRDGIRTWSSKISESQLSEPLTWRVVREAMIRS